MNTLTWAAYAVRLAFGATSVWLLGGVAAVALWRASAAVRHRVWSLATAAVLTLPVLISLLPERRVRPASVPQPTRQVLPNRPVEQSVPALPPIRNWADEGLRPMGAARPTNWTAVGLLAWAVPAALLLLRQLAGWATARRLVRRSRDLRDGPAHSGLVRLANGGRTPRLLESPTTLSPLCVGALRPAVLLPADWRAWSADKLEAVLTHELAHAVRYDVLWQMLAGVAAAVYWPHPLAWLAAWRLRAERELACDDWVVRRGGPPGRYARWLLDFAAAAAPGDAPIGGVAMAAGVGLERRIAALLDAGRRRLPVSRRTSIALVLAASAVATLAGSLSPLPRTRAAPRPTTGPATRRLPLHITGRVLSTSREPVAGVRVTGIVGNQTVEATSGSDGAFDLAADGTGLGYVTLSATAGDRAAYAAHGEWLDRATQLASADLILKPLRVLAVNVVDGRHRPVASAWVGVPSFAYRADAESETTTDAAGRAMVRVPADFPVQYVLAEKPGVGLDYVLFWHPGQPHTDPYRQATDAAGPFTLVLNGAAPVTVRVADPADRPLAGVVVDPWLYDKPRHGDQVNLSFFTSPIQRTTGADGTVTFDTVPADEDQPITFWPQLDGYYQPERCVYDPATGQGRAKATLARLVHLGGTVLGVDGRPAAGAEVEVAGEGYHFADAFHSHVTTDAAGRFGLDANPDLYYLFVASDPAKHLASRAVLRVVRDGPPADPIQLQLQAATRVHGHLTTVPDGRPAPGVMINFQQDDRSYYDLPPAQQLPGGTAGRQAVMPMDEVWLRTDAAGAYEFWAGPEAYAIFARVDPYDAEQKTLTVTGQPDVEINLTVPTGAVAGVQYLSGRVVNRDPPGTGVLGATVSAASTVDSRAFLRDATTGRDGRFTIDRALGDPYLYATVPDRSRAGLVVVPSAVKTATIPLGPTATATGRLLDAQGRPAAGYQVLCGTKQTLELAFGGGSAVTGSDGRFTITGIVPGTDYQLDFSRRNPDGGWSNQSAGRGDLRAERPGSLEIGDQHLAEQP